MSNNNSFFPLKSNVIYRKSKINKKCSVNGDENINKNIGPYLITNKIKEGNNSRIYLGLSKYTNDNVAIKVISKEILQENLEDLTLIYNQIESLKILKHKNIISLYEIYESPKYFYLVMEYLPKKNLIEKIILKKRLNENETLIIFVQLLDAMVYMHKMNITHRNIRTEHILFDKNNRPKIIGFNYSTFYEKNKKLDGMFGSLCYTCPEILNEEEYNPELADVWSLGVVLYVMICGYLPFSEENDEKNKNLIIEGKVDYPKEISNKLKDLMKHMLEVNSNKRYNFQKIIKHPWVKRFTDNKNMFIGGVNIIEMKYCIDERILNIIEKYYDNFKKDKIRKDLIENKFNEGTGLYKLLLRKIIDMKINSLSDLFSADFLKYIQNKNNYINQNVGDNNLYNKYIENANNRKNKIENFINDYKKNEDEVVKYLLNIENLKKSIGNSSDMNNIPNSNILKNSIPNNINNSNVLNYSIKMNNPDKKEKPNNNNKNNEEKKDDDLDIDIIQKFKEEQSKKKAENPLLNNKTNNFSQSLLYKKLDKANSQNVEINKNLFKKNNINNFITNKLDAMKSITPDSQKFINQILIQKERDDKINESLLYSIRKKCTNNFNTNSRKSHIDRGSLLDGYLKKNHPENIRKTLLRFSLFSNISEEEDDEKKVDKKLDEIKSEEENNDSEKKNERRKMNELKYSLSFMDDGDGDEGESDFNESSYISRNDTRFISEIKNALKELNTLKKREREKEKYNSKEKENEKEKEKENVNNNEINVSPKRTNLRGINEKETKEKTKNVTFAKYQKNKFDNNNFIKENVNNFIINNKDKKEDKNNNGNNYIIFEGSDFSFHEEINENIIKSIKNANIVKLKNSDISIYKNDKLTISKLNNVFNDKDFISINNIENKRNKLYIFTFSFDKYKLKKFNIENNITNIDKIKIHNDVNKIENYEIFDNLYKDQDINTKNNNVIKYQESIFNKSNNPQSEPIINSSNNSYTSNNKNSSIINIHNELNEDDDSMMFKIIDKNRDSNRDTSLDISSIKRNSKIIKDKNNDKIFDNELKNNHNKKQKNVNNAKKAKIGKNSSCFINKKSNNLLLSLSEKKKNNKSHRNIIRNKSLENKPKNFPNIGKVNSATNSIRINKKENNSNINSEKYIRIQDKKKFEKLQNEFKHNLNNNINNYNTYKNFDDLKNKKNSQNNKYQKKHGRYSSLINDTNINIDNQIIKKDPKMNHIKTVSFYQDTINRKSFDIQRGKNLNKKESNLKKNKIIKNKNESNLSKNNLNNKNKSNKSLGLIKPVNNEQNKIIKRNNNKPKFIEIKTCTNKSNNTNKNNNKNVIHEKVKINKKPNKTLENMLLKRKEMVKKIRNCKIILNNIYSDNKKFYTANQTEENILSDLEPEHNNNINNLKLTQYKNDDLSKEHKKLKTDANMIIDNAKYNTNNTNINKNAGKALGNKFKSGSNSPKNNLVYQNDKLSLGLNTDYNSIVKKDKAYNSFIQNNGYDGNMKNYCINNISINLSSISQDNYSDKNNNRKKLVSQDTNNNKISCCSNSSIKPCSDFNDTFLNSEDISFIITKSKKLNFLLDKYKK